MRYRHLGLLALVFAAGCITGKPIALYPGKERSAADVAYVRNSQLGFVVAVDGKPVSFSFPPVTSETQYALLPGAHRITVSASLDTSVTPTRGSVLDIDATLVAGRTYGLLSTVEEDSRGASWRCQLVDMTTGQTVGRVTVVESPRPLGK